jgi:hypothetical protein
MCIVIMMTYLIFLKHSFRIKSYISNNSRVREQILKAISKSYDLFFILIVVIYVVLNVAK